MNATAEGAISLAAEFEGFIEAANRLESSHLELQEEVTRLRRELEERNRALESSLEQVESTRLLLSRILEALPCGVILLENSRFSTALANQEARKLLGLTSVAGDEIPQSVKHALSSVDWNTDTNSKNEIVIEADGVSRWLSLKTKRVQLTDKAAEGTRVLIVQDVSAEKQLERDREQVRNSLALAEMSSVLAHEIRNPLGAMELFISLLQSQGSLTSEALGWTDHLSAGVRSLSATVNNVLQFYATGSFAKSRTQAWPIVQESVELLRPVASQSAISISWQNHAAGVEIEADPNAIRQVVLNLCSNALRHSPENSTVTVCMSTTGHKVLVDISDRGQGIAPEHLPHIFEAGYSGAGRRSGLGLAVCKRIAEAHGGDVKVVRTNESGTTMRLEIPCL